MQISDSHIGFNKGANPDVTGTLKKAIDRINMAPAGMKAPDFMIHTGDITQNSKAAEFDTAAQVIKGFKNEVFYVPGEHDFIDDGEQYKQRFGKDTVGNGWYSYNHKGVHFVGLNNCVQVDAMGNMGNDQLAWLKSDLAGLSHSTPIVVFAHIPLWMVYEKWGWGTKDGEQALALLKPFGSVTVLNGHIHQVVQKVEGNVAFHTAMATAFPQPAPGAAPNPGPMTVPAGKLQSVLGVTKVKVVRGHNHLAVIDSTLAETADASMGYSSIDHSCRDGTGICASVRESTCRACEGARHAAARREDSRGCEGGAGNEVRGLPLERNAVAGVCEGSSGVMAD